MTKIIHRYGDFGVTTDVSVDFDQRFMSITYYGFYEADYQYINAIYDLTDIYMGHDEPYYNCYIMQSFTTGVNKQPQFLGEHTLIVLSDDANHLKRIDVENKFRAIIYNEADLYSQPLFIVPYTPISSISV